jgi:hypothetical protein
MTMIDERTTVSTKGMVVIVLASLDLLWFTGIILAVAQPNDTVELTLFVVAGLCLLGAAGGLAVAMVKLLRDEKTPMWSYLEDGRKIHGFFAWWGHCAGLWAAVVVTGYNILHSIDLVSAFMSRAG